MPPKRKPDAEKKRNVINVRLDDSLHETLRVAAAESSRSLSGEIQWRLEEYRRLADAYAIATSDRTTQRLLIALAQVASMVERLSEGEKLTGEFTPFTTKGPDKSANRPMTDDEIQTFLLISEFSAFLSRWMPEVEEMRGNINVQAYEGSAAGMVLNSYASPRQLLEGLRPYRDGLRALEAAASDPDEKKGWAQDLADTEARIAWLETGLPDTEEEASE